MDTDKIKDFMRRDISSYKIIEMVEVYRTDDDGRKTKSLGFFKDPDIATAFAGSQIDAKWYRTEPVLVLTDGKVGFIVDVEEVTLFDDEAEALRIKEGIIAKLSPAERKIMGL